MKVINFTLDFVLNGEISEHLPFSEISLFFLVWSIIYLPPYIYLSACKSKCKYIVNHDFIRDLNSFNTNV